MKKFLVIQTASIGDVILATPVIEKINNSFSEVKIDFLLKKGSEGLFRKHPFLDEVLIWNKSERKYKNLLDLIQLIRRKKYDYVINVQRFASSGLLTVFSGAKKTIGFNKNPLSLFFTKRIKHRIRGKKDIHEKDRNLQLLDWLDIGKEGPVRLYPSQEDNALVSQYKTHAYICIAPASLWFTKQYPLEKWVEFIKMLDQDYYLYFLGSAGDKELCEKIIQKSAYPDCLNLAGKLSFLQTAALMKDAVMNFSNDSAPQHLASSVNAPITTIFCSTVATFGFGPLSDNSQVIETNEKLKCRPCGLHGFEKCPEGHFKCAYSIDNQELIDRLAK